MNPGDHRARVDLDVVFQQRESSAGDARIAIGSRIVPISAGKRVHGIRLHVRPGVTTIKFSVYTPGVRCRSVPDKSLPSISVKLHPDRHAA